MQQFIFSLFFAISLFFNHAYANNSEPKNKKPLILLLFGSSGSGQGVLAVKISKALSIPHISSADLVFAAINEDTDIGMKAKEYLNIKGSIPDQLFMDMLYERIHNSDCKEGFLLNTLPRTAEQAKNLNSALGKDYRIVAISIIVSDETVCQRLANRLICHNCGRVYHKLLSPPKKNLICDYCGNTLSQREDDTSESVKRRLLEYQTAEAPVLEFYKKENLLQEVSGDLTLEEVFDIIMQKVK